MRTQPAFRFIGYDASGNVLFDATEEAPNRAEALTKLMTYPHWQPGHREKLHQIEIFDRKD